LAKKVSFVHKRSEGKQREKEDRGGGEEGEKRGKAITKREYCKKKGQLEKGFDRKEKEKKRGITLKD